MKTKLIGVDAMRRGTTPTHVFSVDADLTSADAIYITYRQNQKNILEKTIEDITVTEKKIETQLTQQETLMFQKGEVEIQIRVKMPDGSAYASQIMKVPVEMILKEGVI